MRPHRRALVAEDAELPERLSQRGRHDDAVEREIAGAGLLEGLADGDGGEVNARAAGLVPLVKGVDAWGTARATPQGLATMREVQWLLRVG